MVWHFPGSGKVSLYQQLLLSTEAVLGWVSASERLLCEGGSITLPYNASISTNIGSKLLRIIDKYFPPSHPLRKICNRNTLKLSYSGMPKVATIISSHNKRLLTETQPNTTSVDNCNSRNKDTCLLPGKCQTKRVVHQATIKRNDITRKSKRSYVGITKGALKTRYSNHPNSFQNPKNKNRTALSKYIWKLKDSKIEFGVSWKIIKKCRGYSSHTKKCNLSLHEKYIIICHPKLSSLNSRNELVSTCRHRRKYLLCNYFNDFNDL